jgi:hypothetical protein
MTRQNEPTERISSEPTEPIPDRSPEGETAGRTISPLRRPLLGWAVAGVVFGAALGVSIWQAGERADLQEELAGTAAELRQTQRRITRLSESLERAVGRSVGLSRGIDTCVGALDDQVNLFNALARELSAVRAFDQSRAESFHRRAQDLRRAANRSLGRCRGAGATA